MKRARKPLALGLALAASILILVATHAVTNRPSGHGPHLTVHFIQTTEQGLATLEEWLGFSLDPQAGRCILTTAELHRVTDVLFDTPGFKTLGTHTFDFSTTNTHTLESDRTITYAAEFKRKEQAEGESDRTTLEVEKEAERMLGFHGTVCLGKTYEDGRRQIVLVLERTELTGWKQFRREAVRMPCFKDWSLTTTLLLALDEAAVLVSRPYNAFEESALFSKDKPTRDKVFLVILSLESLN